MDKQEERNLFDRLELLKREINQLRNRLNSLNDQKESAIRKKREVSGQIIALIKSIKSAKTNRDELTKQVRNSKERRREINDEIGRKIEEAKRLNEEKRRIMQKYNIQGNPEYIKEEIEKLEYKIETEAFPYREEKKVMDIIKEKKKQYEEAKKVSDVFEKMHILNREIEKLRRKCDDAHKKVQARAGTSQERHEEMIETSGEIDGLRVKEKEHQDKIDGFNKEMEQINEDLGKKLLEMNEVSPKTSAIREEAKAKRESTTYGILESKRRAAEEKLAKGEKLTTEDLIAMQGMR